MDQAEEQQLAAQLAKMDEGAWREFCRSCSGPLAAFVRVGLGFGHDESEEIVQMTFLRCVRSIRTFDHRRGRLMAWLKAIAKNEAHTFHSSRGDRGREVPQSLLPQALAEEILQGLDRTPLPEEITAREDVRLLVQEVLAGLNSRGCEALTLKYLHGLPVSAIAEKLNASEKAVESLLTRAREAFRAELVRRLGPGWAEEIR
jgi:RNA polymerase sigma-70 factor (ECF subfamily)